MRGEREIIHSVLALAERDDGVRAVIRTDLLPVREYLHSCNFIFVVNNIDRYDGDVFRDSLGDRILLFRADRSYPELFPGAKAHLMVFDDGATIVVQAMGRDAFLERYNGGHEQLDVWIGDTYQKLLDKDGLLTMDDRLEERQTRSSEIPTGEAFADACDEFWWVMKTFAEYTLRRELPAAMYYLNVSHARPAEPDAALAHRAAPRSARGYGHSRQPSGAAAGEGSVSAVPGDLARRPIPAYLGGLRSRREAVARSREQGRKRMRVQIPA